MKLVRFAVLSLCLALPKSAAAAVIIDLSGNVTGTTIDAIGATFTQAFAGQSVSGISLTGSPTNPLASNAAGSITVASFSPGVSPTSNSLLSQPGNVAPLAILFDSPATSLTFTMGSSVAGSSVLVSYYSSLGALLGSQSLVMLNEYNIYTVSNPTAFAGLTFSNNNDPAGVRFQNLSYETGAANVVPEPASLILLGSGLLAVAARRRKRSSAPRS